MTHLVRRLPTKYWLYRRVGIAFLLISQCALHPQTKVEQRRAVNCHLRCTIQIDLRQWTPGAPSVLTGKIENLSEGSLETAVEPVLYLSSATSSAERDKYWAPVDLFRDRPLAVRRTSIRAGAEAIRAVPIQLKFTKKGDAIDFRIDAQHVRWARKISSVWPSQKLFSAVEPGLYDIHLVLESANGDSQSERIRIVVAASGPPKRKPN